MELRLCRHLSPVPRRAFLSSLFVPERSSSSRVANSVFMRKLNGAVVEPGPHFAEVESRCEGVRREQDLVIR